MVFMSTGTATRPEVIEELRSLFRRGATPTRLIRHIVDRHANVPDVGILIQDYFSEAFAVGLLRGLRKGNPLDGLAATLAKMLVTDGEGTT
jgi:hypothetical protein